MFDFLLPEEREVGSGDEVDLQFFEDPTPLTEAAWADGSHLLGAQGSDLPTIDGDAEYGEEEGLEPPPQDAADDSGVESEEIDTAAILQHLAENERDDGEYGGSSSEEDDEMDAEEGGAAQGRAARGQGAGPSAAGGRKGAVDYNTLKQQRSAGGGKRGRGKQSRKAQDKSAAQEFEDLLTKTGTLVTRRRRQGRANAHRKRSALRRGQAMTEEVTAKLGEANLMYATGRLTDAQALLKEVIRLAPNVPDSYQTLALIHEALDQPQKALDFMLIAAHMGKREAEPWRRLAAQSVELKNLRQAIYCLSRVCKFDLGDVDARWDRAVLLSEIGDVKKAAQAFEGLRKMRPHDVEVVKNLARLYHQLQNPALSMEVVESYIRGFPDQCDLTLVNILAELYLCAGRFEDTIQLMENTKTVLCPGDEPLPLDLLSKSIVSMLNIGQMERAAPHVATLKEAAPEEFYDLYRDVAEAYWAQGNERGALDLLSPLRAVPACDTPALWERIAACRIRLGDLAGAVAEYESAVQEHPGHPDALTALAKLLPGLGRTEEAQRILMSLEEVANSEIEPGKAAELKLKAASLRLATGDVGAFLQLAVQPVTQSLAALAAAAKAAEATGFRKPAGGVKKRIPKAGVGRAEGVFRGFVTRPHPAKRHKPTIVQQPIALEQPVVPTLITDPGNLKLVIEVCRALVDLARLNEAATVCAAAMPFLKGRLWSSQLSIELHWLAACIADKRGDSMGAAKAARVVINQHPEDLAAWNLFAKTTAQVGLTRFAPFIGKTVLKFPTCLPAVLIQAHTLSVQGAWGPGLSRLLLAFRMAPNEPLVCLSTGVALLHHGMSRKVSDRLKALLAAVAFLQRYASLRGMSQEAAYNLGRAFHQLGLPHLAMTYYERALAEPPQGEPGGQFDLRRETAHNLALLYINSGAPGLARKVLRKFAVV